MVCDFTQFAGRTLYLWNNFDDDRMNDVPFYCYSHLVARIDVAADCGVSKMLLYQKYISRKGRRERGRYEMRACQLVNCACKMRVRQGIG